MLIPSLALATLLASGLIVALGLGVRAEARVPPAGGTGLV